MHSGDGRAPETELGGDTLEVNPEQGEQRGACGRVRLSQIIVSTSALQERKNKWTYALHAVAALHGPGAAAAGTGVVGGREDGEGERGEDGEAGEHSVGEWCGWKVGRVEE